MSEVRFAAYVPAGAAGERGKFSAFCADSDIPASLREGARGSPGNQSGFYRNFSTFGGSGIEVPLRVNGPATAASAWLPVGIRSGSFWGWGRRNPSCGFRGI